MIEGHKYSDTDSLCNTLFNFILRVEHLFSKENFAYTYTEI